jgi:hypothetical protein
VTWALASFCVSSSSFQVNEGMLLLQKLSLLCGGYKF